MLMKQSTILAVLLATFTGVAFAGDRFPEWRGVNGQGHAAAKNLPSQWSDSKNVGWKVEIPGRGWSTPVIENGQVWLTTAVDVKASKAEEARRRKLSTNSQPLRISSSVSCRVIGIDLNSGKVLRNVEVLSEKDPQYIHVQNTYATPTPVIENGRLYCHYGPSGTACYDIKANKVLWTNRTLRVKHENGPGSSPILWRDLLIIHCDGIDKQYITALSKKTGKQVWKTMRSGKLKENPQLKKSYATSLIVDVGGKPVLISPAADWLYGYEPATGKELWKISYGTLGFSNAGRPIAGDGMVYTCTGYMRSQMLAIKLGEEGATKPTVAWTFKRQVPNVSSPLLIGDEIYFASDNGVASCIDARTGKTHWTQRIGKKFWASPLYADGKIHFFSIDGITTVIKPGKEYQQLAKNKLEGEIFASAAAVDGALIVRTDKAVYCIR